MSVGSFDAHHISPARRINFAVDVDNFLEPTGELAAGDGFKSDRAARDEGLIIEHGSIVSQIESSLIMKLSSRWRRSMLTRL